MYFNGKVLPEPHIYASFSRLVKYKDKELIFQVDKIPYCQLPLHPVKRDPPQQEGQTVLPVNIANGSINFDMRQMASGVTSGLNNQSNPQPENPQHSWWNIVKDAAAAVTPSGQAPSGFGEHMNGHGATNGQALNYDMKLPDGKRLAYRMDYVVKESGNSYIAAVTSHTAYWCNKDIAFLILTKLFPELEYIPIPPNLPP